MVNKSFAAAAFLLRHTSPIGCHIKLINCPGVAARRLIQLPGWLRPFEEKG
jgi:hypothetical protein